MNRQARLLAITEYLRARRTGVTAQALSTRFGVTLRTIYRDLDLLRDAELPLHAEQGRGGGYALDRHYTLPPINLNAREAAVLLAVGSHAVQLRLVPFTDALERGLDKVRGALSASAQRELLALLPQLQFLGVPALAAPAKVRKVVEEAWFTQTAVELQYRSSDSAVSTSTVRIVRLLMDRHHTLLRCVDEQTRSERSFRLDRIERATLVVPTGRG